MIEEKKSALRENESLIAEREIIREVQRYYIS